MMIFKNTNKNVKIIKVNVKYQKNKLNNNKIKFKIYKMK